MDVKITRSKVGTILLGIASIALGVIIFMNPNTAAATLVVTIGWVLTVLGVVLLISAIASGSAILSTIDLYNGALSLLMGVLILMAPGFFVVWIFVLLGIYIVMAGFYGLLGANALRVLGVSGSGWGIVASILTIVLGVLVTCSPFMMASISMVLAGVALVFTGIVQVVDGIKMPGKDKA